MAYPSEWFKYRLNSYVWAFPWHLVAEAQPRRLNARGMSNHRRFNRFKPFCYNLLLKDMGVNSNSDIMRLLKRSPVRGITDYREVLIELNSLMSLLFIARATSDSTTRFVLESNWTGSRRRQFFCCEGESWKLYHPFVSRAENHEFVQSTDW